MFNQLQEIWKDIKGFESMYQVSNQGNVRSLRAYAKKRGRLLALRTNYSGYIQTDLCKNSKKYTFRVNRLVAEAFIPNPHHYPQVNHIDENKKNNDVSNLEGCTAKYNCNYGNKTKYAGKKISESHKKKVVQISKSGMIVKIWTSIKEAQQHGFNNISACCSHKRRTSSGYRWEYYED